MALTRSKPKSGDPFDQTLASLERAAPLSPKRELQHGRRPVAFAALFTTKACDLRAVEALVEAGFEEGRAADRPTTMLEAPARRGPWGERNIQRMPEAASEGVFGVREPARR